MVYLFQRTIQNHFQWTRPSPGRLGPSGEGAYVQENGFGSEDWNFNKSLLINGHVYGYCYYRPTEARKKEAFSIAFATYTNRQWYLVGFYLNSTFVEDPSTDERVLRRKMKDLKQLGPSLGQKWRKRTDKAFLREMRVSARSLNWRIDPDNAIRLPQPVRIPKRVFDTKNYRIVKPTELKRRTFEALFRLAQESSEMEDHGLEDEFPEGRELERTHKARERNQALVKAAKVAFKKRNGKLHCQICKFDFAAVYGDVGLDFIEAHHTVPVSELSEQVKAKVSQIAMVCSNCHRMLHRKRPWLTMKELQKLMDP